MAAMALGCGGEALVPGGDVVAPSGSTVAVAAGDKQTATVGEAVRGSPSVVVRDPSGKPVVGVRVHFEVAAGGGSVTGADQRTDTSGVATAGA